MSVPGSLTTAHATLEVRPLRIEEAELVVAYFRAASAADLDRMGVDPERIPDAAPWVGQLQETIRRGPHVTGTFYYAWTVDGTTVGFSSLKNLHLGDRADIHLHMWSAPHRGHGHGAALFCLTAVDAYARFHLLRLVCEPKATNPMPNRMLARIGFPLVATYNGASSELSAMTTLNQYAIRPEIAAAYLRSVHAEADAVAPARPVLPS